MRVRIHRGAAEIGGNCLELEAEGERILLDLGLPLDTDSAAEPELPDVAGVREPDPSLLGVVITHPHPDHYGLVPRMPGRIPLFIGAGAESILRESAFFTGAAPLPAAVAHLRHRSSFTQGAFKITPFLVDHSAFDSYALLVEAGGRRLFYSGDLRGHGRKPGSFELLVAQPPEGVHALVLEGTRIEGGDRGLANEREVEDRCADVFAKTGGLSLAMFSPQNVDRLVTIFRAARRTGRELVVDLYGASVATATEHATIPQPGFEGLRVYVPQRQRILVKRSGEFDRVNAIAPYRIFADELAADPSRFVVLFRHSMARELEREAGLLDGATALWSMWPGYLEVLRGRGLTSWLDSAGIPMEIAHCSGHATLADLRRVAESIDARRVIPIHTARPELFEEHFGRVQRVRDGEWWEV